ncbi:MAG: sulfate reduction electron transfer complex DsrMKJOP subunit DsrP [Planctomycetota bacterium]
MPIATPLIQRPGFLAFLRISLQRATDGSPLFYAWMTMLTCVALVGANAWAHQVVNGMQVTGMSDHVSWGLYISNFTFFVGVAAAAVMMVIPAYLYHDHEMHDTVIVGELLAISAIFICLLSVTVDLGRPDRMWHMMPGIGRFNWPISMLTWDVLVLNGYMLLNLWICSYLLWCRWRGVTPAKRFYLPFVFISIVWAVSIHTVTAFLYCGLGGRPFWNTALLAPRFLASAFVAGPAFIIIALLALQRFGSYPFGDGPIRMLVKVIRITALINLFMLGVECFTALYAGSTHAASLRYLLFGSHGHYALVPWMWSAIALNVIAAGLFLWPGLLERRRLLALACAMTFIGIWIEKGMGLVIPGFIPSTLHELVEFTPSLTEWKVTFGIMAAGLLVYTLLLKVAIPLLSGWTPGLSVGVAAMDVQHRALFERINDLVVAIRFGADKTKLGLTVDFLDDYVREHFSAEEKLMADVNYPGLAQHRLMHAGFISELDSIRAALAVPDCDKQELAERLHLSLRDWLLRHIQHEDHDYGEYIAKNHPHLTTA